MQTVYYHRKGRALVFSVSKPPANWPGKSRRSTWKQNPIIVALKLQEQLEALPEKTHGALAKQIGISRGMVCQYLGLLKLPGEVLNYMVDPGNEQIVGRISEQALHDLLRLPNEEILGMFRALVSTKRSL